MAEQVVRDAEQPSSNRAAEWVAEAPSVCRTMDVCEVVPLSDFGKFCSGGAGGGGGAPGPRGGRGGPVPRGALVTGAGSSRYIAASNRRRPGPVTAGGRGFTIAFGSSFAGAVPAHPLRGSPVPPWVP